MNEKLTYAQLENYAKRYEDLYLGGTTVNVDEEERLKAEFGYADGVVPLTPRGVDWIVGLYDGNGPDIADIKARLMAVSIAVASQVRETPKGEEVKPAEDGRGEQAVDKADKIDLDI